MPDAPIENSSPNPSDGESKTAPQVPKPPPPDPTKDLNNRSGDELAKMGSGQKSRLLPYDFEPKLINL